MKKVTMAGSNLGGLSNIVTFSGLQATRVRTRYAHIIHRYLLFDFIDKNVHFYLLLLHKISLFLHFFFRVAATRKKFSVIAFSDDEIGNVTRGMSEGRY